MIASPITTAIEEPDIPEATGSSVAADWCPHPGRQSEALSRSEYEVMYGGARGGGKSDGGLAWLAEPEYIEHKGFSALVIRKNSKDLGDWVRRAVEFYGDMVSWSGNPPVGKCRAGGVIITGHLKDANAYEQYQGHEYQKMLIEEATQIPDERNYHMLRMSCRSVKYPQLKPQIFLTCNPGGPGHAWVKTRFVDPCRKLKPGCDGTRIDHYTYHPYRDPKSGSWRVFVPSTVDDNPALMNKNPEYVRELESLQEPYLSAWRYGNWDIFVGQYFLNFGKHLEEEPFEIFPHDCEGRLFAGLDYGSGMSGISASGLVWLDNKLNIPHRLLTWHRTGLTASEQADDLYETWASFHWTSGKFPDVVVYDNSMDVKANLRSHDEWAPIDYFKQRFRGTNVRWERAIKQRVQGWQVMLDYFGMDIVTGLPKFRYWAKYNKTFADIIPLLVRDDNNPDDVLKCDIDHEADECRYLLVWLKRRQESGQSKGRMLSQLPALVAMKQRATGDSMTGWL